MSIFKYIKKIIKTVCIFTLAICVIPLVGSIYVFTEWFDCCKIEYKVEISSTPLKNPNLHKEIKAQKEKIDRYHRPLLSTYLTFPEWWIVYSSQEYAQFLSNQRPSQFPYLASIFQFWQAYCHVNAMTKPYATNTETHIMLMVIGTSLTLEYLVKWGYENTIGRLTEWSSNYQRTPEDDYAYQVADAYGKFIPIRPWYEFSFSNHVAGLWNKTPLWGENVLRSWERKIILSAEYGFKAFYAWLIEQSTHAAFGVAETKTSLLSKIDKETELSALQKKYPTITVLYKNEKEHLYILSLDRYQPFTEQFLYLSKFETAILDIADNEVIMLSAVVDQHFDVNIAPAKIAFTLPILTDKTKKRIAVVTSVHNLANLCKLLESAHGKLEHIYDY